MAARNSADEMTVILAASRANVQRWIHMALGRNDGVRGGGDLPGVAFRARTSDDGIVCRESLGRVGEDARR
jgi:hypothetical protein